MPAFRYATEERQNIAAALKTATRVSAFNASLARRKAVADAQSTIGGLTKADVGLDEVDNTSDADKPISTATQTALDTKLTIVAVPATAADSGEVGQVAIEPGFLYVCVGPDEWERVALATW